MKKEKKLEKKKKEKTCREWTYTDALIISIGFPDLCAMVHVYRLTKPVGSGCVVWCLVKEVSYQKLNHIPGETVGISGELVLQGSIRLQLSQDSSSRPGDTNSYVCMNLLNSPYDWVKSILTWHLAGSDSAPVGVLQRRTRIESKKGLGCGAFCSLFFG